jgi:hypothetical protein
MVITVERAIRRPTLDKGYLNMLAERIAASRMSNKPLDRAKYLNVVSPADNLFELA